MTMLKQAIEDATSFQAEIDDDLFEVERMLEGAQTTVDVEFLGKVWVFGSLDDFWESWALSEMPAVDDVYLRHRLRKAPYVAAAFIGFRQQDGSVKKVEDMFRPKDKAQAGLANLSSKTRQSWARRQFLLWLRSGSSNGDRSGQSADLIEKLFNDGVMKASDQNREALAKIDPFFAAGQEVDLLQSLLGLGLEQGEAAAPPSEEETTPIGETTTLGATDLGTAPRVDTLDGPSGLTSSDGLVTF